MVDSGFVDFQRSLEVNNQTYRYFSIDAAQEILGDLSSIPRSLRIIIENLLRNSVNYEETVNQLRSIALWLTGTNQEILFFPVRVLMQDFTGVPAIVDLAAMRDAIVKMGGNPKHINPLAKVDLVIDHSISVDNSGDERSSSINFSIEMKRNLERYTFLRWGQKTFNNFNVVPPGTGICHQVNLEHIAEVVSVLSDSSGDNDILFPDTVIGTDSHTTMINGLSVLGWGVGGIEAEAVMLGQPLSMVVPDVVGFELTGALQEGRTATDLVLTITEKLRNHGVVGKFIEFFGDALPNLTLADRATIANMAPEYGATCGYFPVDEETISYLKITGRSADQVEIVEAYAKTQGLWHSNINDQPKYKETLSLNIATVEPSISGPKRPQDRISLDVISNNFLEDLNILHQRKSPKKVFIKSINKSISDGDVVIAAITSCTNTSNPSVMVAAGLLARKAVAMGLEAKPWVKTSLAPGSQVVSDYLKKSGLQKDLDALGFNVVGYGCTTCIGNSGPLNEEISDAANSQNLILSSVLSGNRNFEGRVNKDVVTNYLTSPPLVVAYAIAGNVTCNLISDPLGKDKNGLPIFLKDIWPSNKEISELVSGSIDRDMFHKRYKDVFSGPIAWQEIEAGSSLNYRWNPDSTYVCKPPFFENLTHNPAPIKDIYNARPLAILGDSITTDHISPAGSFDINSSAGKYLSSLGVKASDFNSYGSRRGNHEVMMRGTFANIRIRNLMLPDTLGGITKKYPEGQIMPIYDAAMSYKKEETPLIVIAGKNYGSGSSRDWAAKGPGLLGVQAVIAESFERIHRTNLIGVGIIPLEFEKNFTRSDLNINGDETFNFIGISNSLSPGDNITCEILRLGKKVSEVSLISRIDTDTELEYFKHGGILHYVLREILNKT